MKLKLGTLELSEWENYDRKWGYELYFNANNNKWTRSNGIRPYVENNANNNKWTRSNGIRPYVENNANIILFPFHNNQCWAVYFYGHLKQFMTDIHQRDKLTGPTIQVQNYIDNLVVKMYNLRAFK